ncbi:preprotein translocase subunit SecE [bacterium]|nr:MAG: preprotein translocase subunit SecE [bacterium]
MAKAKTPGGPKPVTRGFRPGKGPSVPAAQSTVTIDAPEPAKKKTSIPQFFSQVRAEMRKIVWPSRKETWITSVMVFIMVVLASAFFWIVDTGLGFASRFILALGQ